MMFYRNRNLADELQRRGKRFRFQRIPTYAVKRPVQKNPASRDAGFLL